MTSHKLYEVTRFKTSQFWNQVKIDQFRFERDRRRNDCRNHNRSRRRHRNRHRCCNRGSRRNRNRNRRRNLIVTGTCNRNRYCRSNRNRRLRRNRNRLRRRFAVDVSPGDGDVDGDDDGIDYCFNVAFCRPTCSHNKTNFKLSDSSFC